MGKKTSLLPVCFSFLFFLLLIPQWAQGQSSALTSATGNEVLARARTLYAEEGPKTALPEFEKALLLFQSENNRLGEAITLGLIGNCYKRFGDFPKALDYLRRALAGKQSVGDRLEEGKTLSHLGLLYWEMSEYPRAIEHFTKAIAIGSQLKDRILEASSRNNLGLVFDEVGEYRKSLQEYHRALDLYSTAEKELGGSNPTIERGKSDTVGNVGGTSLLLGEYAEALRYYQQALAMDEKGNRKPGMTLDLQNIGLCYTGLGRLSDALQSFDRAINIAAEAGLKKEEADARKGKASAFLQLGKYNEARDQYRVVLDVYEKAGLKQQLVEAFGDLGELDLRLGDAASAEKQFRKALELSKAINHPRGITVNLMSLGSLEWRQKRFNEAAALYRSALARADESNDRAASARGRIQLAAALTRMHKFSDAATEAQQALEIAVKSQASPLEAEARYMLGEIARESGEAEQSLKHFAVALEVIKKIGSPELSWRVDFGRGQSLQRLNRNEEALAAYLAAAETIEQVRNELREERFRAGYLEDKYQVYVALVELLLKVGRLDEAFVFSEKLRARSYLDLIGRGPQPIRNEAQRLREKTLRNRIQKLQENLDQEFAKPAPEQRRAMVELFSNELTRAEREYQNLLDDLRSADPDFARIDSVSVPTGNEVKQKLDSDTALIEYVMSERSLSIFVLSASGLKAITVPVVADDLRSRVQLLRSLMERNQTDEWKLPADRLYRSLISPIEEAGWLAGLSRIYIVPHSILHYVPFGALRHAAGKREQLLVQKYSLAYLPAAAALVNSSKSQTSQPSILAMAPSSPRLQYTQQESLSISPFFPAKHTLLLGEKATESSFKSLAAGYDVIHLATHGYFNKINPLLSGVVLEADSNEDGRLEVHEILELRLHAQLVTLSACNTALGSGYFADVPAGDDIVGLTRAFLFAGSPSVLATLWEVNDLSSVRLMRGFYRELGNADKAAALARIQRRFLAPGSRYRHPYYWAPFVLVGQMN